MQDSSCSSSSTKETDNRFSSSSNSNSVGEKRKLDLKDIDTANYQNFPHNLEHQVQHQHSISIAQRAVSNSTVSTISTTDTTVNNHTVLDWKPTTRLGSGFLGQDLVRPNAPPSNTDTNAAASSLYKSNSSGSGCSLRMKPNSYTRFSVPSASLKRKSRRVSNVTMKHQGGLKTDNNNNNSSSSSTVHASSSLEAGNETFGTFTTSTGVGVNDAPQVVTMKPNPAFVSRRGASSAPASVAEITPTIPASVTVTMQPNTYMRRGFNSSGGFSRIDGLRSGDIRVNRRNEGGCVDDLRQDAASSSAMERTLQPNTNAVFRNALMEHNRARIDDAFYSSGELNYVLNTRCLHVPRDITVHVNFKDQEEDCGAKNSDNNADEHEKPTNYIYLFSKAGNVSTNTLTSEL